MSGAGNPMPMQSTAELGRMWNISNLPVLCTEELLRCFPDGVVHVWQVNFGSFSVKPEFRGIASCPQGVLEDVMKVVHLDTYFNYTGPRGTQRLICADDFEIDYDASPENAYEYKLKEAAPFELDSCWHDYVIQADIKKVPEIRFTVGIEN